MNTTVENPFVFIVGCPRSGTTLLQRLVDAHPRIAIIHEMYWLLSWYRQRIGLTQERTVTPELVSRLVEYPKFAKRVKIGQTELEGLLKDGGNISYARFMTGVFDLYGKARGKMLVGDKTPKHILDIPALHELWPSARFVHLLRDGRDVFLSVANWERADRIAARFPTWAQDPVGTTALWWELHVRLGRETGRSLPPQLYYELRYETLVADPAAECGKLCAFLGVPYDDAMLRFHEGRTKAKPGLDAKEAWRPITTGLRDWRSQLSAEQTEKFEAVAGDLLTELGYARTTVRPCQETLQHATKIRSLFGEDLRSRNQLLPQGW